ncbi:MAG: Arc family DNA-binding protein [Flavobacteriaceae bacterium]
MAREDAQFRLRLPEALLGVLKAAAKDNGRTMNAEVVFQLQRAYGHTVEDIPMPKEGGKTESLTLRLTPEVRAKLDEAQAAIPYCPSITKIVERGILLALDELNEMAKALRKPGSAA